MADIPEMLKLYPGPVYYDSGAAMVWSADGQNILLDIRGWGTLKKSRKRGMEIQDEFGRWIADRINESLPDPEELPKPEE